MRIGFRTLGLAGALAILIVAWMSPDFRTTEGEPSGRFAAAIAVVAAVALAFWTARSVGASSGRWLSLALLGHAAALQLIDAGILIHYRHYRLPAQAMADPAMRVALLAI